MFSLVWGGIESCFLVECNEVSCLVGGIVLAEVSVMHGQMVMGVDMMIESIYPLVEAEQGLLQGQD